MKASDCLSENPKLIHLLVPLGPFPLHHLINLQVKKQAVFVHDGSSRTVRFGGSRRAQLKMREAVLNTRKKYELPTSEVVLCQEALQQLFSDHIKSKLSHKEQLSGSS
jgi:hypothetical protein